MPKRENYQKKLASFKNRLTHSKGNAVDHDAPVYTDIKAGFFYKINPFMNYRDIRKCNVKYNELLM